MTVTIPNLASWEPCRDCVGGPRPGARALMAHWLESYPDTATSLGIYNCRDVRGGSSRSIHSCGRADDLGVPVTDAGHAVMYDYLGKLAPHAKRLGLCLVIFDRTIWSAVRAPSGERYDGAHPHDNHAHVELTETAADRLTLATLRAVVGDLRPSGPSPKPEPAPDPGGLTRDDLVDGLPLIDLDDTVRGESVRTLQSLLGARGRPPAASFAADSEPDGIGGPKTRAAVGWMQARKGTGRPSSPTSPDYVVGPATWSVLLGTVKGLRFDRGVVRGSIVETIQALLAARGHPPADSFDPRGNPDGVGGPKTRLALARFQQATGTGAADGSADLIVGPKTWTALVQ